MQVSEAKGNIDGPIRIVFSGHDFKFIKPFIDYLSDNSAYEVRLDEHAGQTIPSEDEAEKFAEWADVIFCEWALGNAVWYSRNKRPGQRLIVRLHSMEVHSRASIPYIYQIDWEKVDKLILICQLTYDFMTAEFPALRAGRAIVIFNPIDARGSLNRPKMEDARFNLGMAGFVPQLKRLDLAVEVLHQLRAHDPRYSLYVKGRRPEQYHWMFTRPDELEWYENIYRNIRSRALSDYVVYDAHGDNMPVWYSKVGFILSMSDLEGSHQAVAEGMAAGCIPIIRNWRGSNALYPSKYIVSSEQEAADLVLEWTHSVNLEHERDLCRKYAQKHFDQGNIIKELEAVVRGGMLEDTAATRVMPCVPERGLLLLALISPGLNNGYSARIREETNQLKRRGFRVHLACVSPRQMEGAAESHRQELEAYGCSVHVISVPNFFDIRLDVQTIENEIDALNRIMCENDLSVIHAQALYCARVALLLKQKYPDKLVAFDCHGVGPEEEAMSGAHPARISATEDWERRALAESDLVIFVSRAMQRFMTRKYGFREGPTAVIPCCVADGAFSWRARASLPVPPNRPVLAYTGSMKPWQCGPQMICLVSQLVRLDPEIMFLCLCSSSEHQVVRELMQEYRLPEDSVIMAELSHEDVGPALRLAHAGILLRTEDPTNLVSSPVKFAEYLAAGLPVILTSRIGDSSDLATQNEVGLLLESELLSLRECPQQEVQRIADFLRKSMAERDTIMHRCVEVARDHLAWHSAGECLAEAIRKIS